LPKALLSASARATRSRSRRSPQAEARAGFLTEEAVAGSASFIVAAKSIFPLGSTSLSQRALPFPERSRRERLLAESTNKAPGFDLQEGVRSCHRFDRGVRVEARRGGAIGPERGSAARFGRWVSQDVTLSSLSPQLVHKTGFCGRNPVG
jgi:hypothetical protein